MSLYYKASSPDYIDNQQVVSRHLSELKRLHAEHSHMPMMNYRANYSKHFHFHFSQIAAFFHNNRCEFEEAYQAVNTMWNMVQSSDNAYKQYRTGTIYFNYFNMQCITGRYKEALDTCSKYAEFIKGNNHMEILPFVNVLKLVLYLNVYPQTFKLDPGYLHEQADEYIKYVKKNENIEISLPLALFLKAMLYLTEANQSKAKAILSKPDIKPFLKEHGIAEFISELFQTNSTEKFTELLKRVHLAKAKTRKSETYQLLQIIGNYVSYKLKKK